MIIFSLNLFHLYNSPAGGLIFKRIVYRGYRQICNLCAKSGIFTGLYIKLICVYRGENIVAAKATFILGFSQNEVFNAIFYYLFVVLSFFHFVAKFGFFEVAIFYLVLEVNRLDRLIDYSRLILQLLNLQPQFLQLLPNFLRQTTLPRKYLFQPIMLCFKCFDFFNRILLVFLNHQSRTLKPTKMWIKPIERLVW